MIKELEEKIFVELNYQGYISTSVRNYASIIRELTISSHTYYKLKKAIITQMKEVYEVVNLKGTRLLPVIANLYKETTIIVEIKLENCSEIALGIIRKTILRNIFFATYMISITKVDEKGMIIEKYPECHLNSTLKNLDRKIFSANKRTHIPCLIVINYTNAYCISKNNWTKELNHYRLGHAKIIMAGFFNIIKSCDHIIDHR